MTVANGSEPKDTGRDTPRENEELPTDAPKSGTEGPTVSDLAAGYAEKAGLHRNSAGHVDMLKSAGGVQGIAESILPGLVFLVVFTITRDLTPALIAALAAAAVFTVVRLIQRRPLTQALAGVVGVGISAWLANTTGKAEDFYVLGFFTNIAYIAAMVLSIAFKWPVAGLLFGFVRNEGLEWRKDPERLRAYSLGTWIVVAVLALRLVVQVPLVLHGRARPDSVGYHQAPDGRPAVHPGPLGGLAGHQAGTSAVEAVVLSGLIH